MSFHLGLPQALYLLVNIGFMVLAMFGEEGGKKAGCALIMWLTTSIPLLIWGGFFS